MAKPTPHAALEGAGFKFRDSQFNGSGDRIGTAMTHHYTMTTPSVGGGGVSSPITHHVFVDEYGNNPGKYNVLYHLAQGSHPYSEGDYDAVRRHVDNAPGGVKDPIAEVMQHHRNVVGALTTRKAPPLVNVTPKNIGLIRDNNLTSFNSAQDRLMDQEDKRLRP